MSKKNHDQFFIKKKNEREATLIKTKKRACLGLEKKKNKQNKTKTKMLPKTKHKQKVTLCPRQKE